MFKRKRGFTLLELMIVVIIVGILASLAVPRFIDAMQKARKGAATEMLGSIRSAQMRYYAENTAYSTSMALLDLDMTGSPDWTIKEPSAGKLGEVKHTNNETYTINQDGLISGP